MKRFALLLILAGNPGAMICDHASAAGKSHASAPSAQAVPSPPPVGQPAAPPTSQSAAPIEPPPPPPTWSAVDIEAALTQCADLLAGLDIEYRQVPAMRTETCGAPAPVTLISFAKGQIAVDGKPVVNCTMARALASWIKDSLQPAAVSMLGSPVKRVAIGTSYQCRNRYGRSSGPISEHAFANAIDLTGFVLADGRKVRVLGGWEKRGQPASTVTKPEAAKLPEPPPASSSKSRRHTKIAQAAPTPPAATDAPADPPPANPVQPERPESLFLRKIHGDACSTFWTVLGPESNAAHHDHFHLDMKVRRSKHICE